MTIGFGTYRIADGNFAHEQALRYALDEGIDLIDTSTNYTAGLSETLIGKVLRNYDPSKIRIISKYGYIQGALLEEEKKNPSIKDVVKYDQSCYHAISPEFMKMQLSASLNRLGLESIDTYLIHNPEYFLMHTVKSQEHKERQQELMLQRIYEAFCALELEVKNGRIKSYGISSNSFSLPEEDLHFLPYKALVTLAKSASKFAKSEAHHFTTVQLPINLLEQEGLKCAAWAKEVGLEVIANRPLNASKAGLMYRLASYRRPTDYEGTLNETLNLFEQIDQNAISNMLQELDAHVHKFAWMGDYESFLVSQVFPLLQNAFQSIAEEDQPQCAAVIEHFFEQYQKMVAFECSKTTLSSLRALGFDDISDPIEDHALKFLLKQEHVDHVLVGMRNIKYVQEAIAIEESL